MPDQRRSGVYLIAEVGDRQVVLPVKVLDRVLPLVEWTAPSHPGGLVLGWVEIHGATVMVIDLRRYLEQPTPPPQLADRLLLLRDQAHPTALLVNRALGVGPALGLRPDAAGRSPVYRTPYGLAHHLDLVAVTAAGWDSLQSAGAEARR